MKCSKFLNKIFSINSKFNNPKDVKVPNRLKDMIKYAEELSKPFKFVRVDFYETNDNEVLFGELTFTPARCSAEYYNNKGDNELGDMLEL